MFKYFVYFILIYIFKHIHSLVSIVLTEGSRGTSLNQGFKPEALNKPNSKRKFQVEAVPVDSLPLAYTVLLEANLNLLCFKTASLDFLSVTSGFLGRMYSSPNGLRPGFAPPKNTDKLTMKQYKRKTKTKILGFFIKYSMMNSTPIL